MLKLYRIDATSLTTDEVNALEKFLYGYSYNISTNGKGIYEVFLENSQSLEGLPQIPESCKVTLLS